MNIADIFMKLACIRPLPKNKNGVIDQSQRALYDTCLRVSLFPRVMRRWEVAVVLPGLDKVFFLLANFLQTFYY